MLSKEESYLLKRRLSFTPTPSYDTFTWVKDVNLFARKLALKKYHLTRERDVRQFIHQETEMIDNLESLARESESGVLNPTGPFTSLKPKSTFTPSLSQYTSIDTFINLVTNDLKKIRSRPDQKFSNLTKGEVRALDTLMTNKNIICKPSDKGGNVVIMDRIQYQKMVLALLNDTATYKILDSNPTQKFLDELKSVLNEAKDASLITQEEFKYMFNPNPTIATLYVLPKIHKAVTPIPGRPNVSGCDNLTQGISVYMWTRF